MAKHTHEYLDVTLPQPALVAALKTASGIADARAKGQPILAHVLLRADQKTGLEILGTDMMVSSTEVLPLMADGLSVAGAGGLCVQARFLLSVASTLPPKPVRLRGLENHWLEMSVGRSTMKLMGVSVSDFPTLPSLEKGTTLVKMTAAGVNDAIEKTMASISTDEARVNLNGLLWECDGTRTTLVSTDGHRLTKLTADLAGPKLEKGAIVPRKGIVHLRSMLARMKSGDIEIGVEPGSSGHMFARAGNLTLALKLAGVVFPPYQQVIPSDVRRSAVVDRAELTAILERALVMAPEKTATVRITYNSKAKELEILADNPDAGTVSDTIDIEKWTGDVDGLIAGYNAQYLLDALRAILTKQVVLQLQGELDPLVIRPVDGPDFLAVVMPMRI